MKGRGVVLAVALMVASACGGDGLGPGELGDLARAQFRWDSRGFNDYAFEMKQLCFCSPLVTQLVRVEVHDDSITQITEVVSDSLIPGDQYNLWPTIDDLFSLIRQVNRDKTVKDVHVQYDAVLGYPRKIEIIPKQNVQDGGGTFELGSLRKIDQ